MRVGTNENGNSRMRVATYPYDPFGVVTRARASSSPLSPPLHVTIAVVMVAAVVVAVAVAVVVVVPYCIRGWSNHRMFPYSYMPT